MNTATAEAVEGLVSGGESNPNVFELNTGDQFGFAIDVSGSMESNDCVGGVTRINALKSKVIDFVKEASKYDPDGIDLKTFGHKITSYDNVTAEKAEEIIGGLKANEASTDTAGVIKAFYERYKEVGSKENYVVFVATDGAPNDREAVKQAIIDITNELTHDKQFNISFLTVGPISEELRKFLTELDDDLKGAKFDIVDVKALDEVDFLTAFVGALSD